MDAELGLLGLVARSETNWAEGMGRVLAGLAARTADRDGAVEAETDKFIQK